MAAVFWLLVLGAGVVTGQPWAFLFLAVLLVCFGLAHTSHPPAQVAPLPPPPRPRVAKAPQAAAPAPVVKELPVDTRQLKRRWREEEHQAWQDDFDRLAAGRAGPSSVRSANF